MHPSRTFTHDELLTLAHKTEAAARDGDRDHLLAERPALLHVPPADARLLEHGQQRVIDMLAELAASAAQHDDHCRCDRLAANLIAELTIQADDERRHLITTTA